MFRWFVPRTAGGTVYETPLQEALAHTQAKYHANLDKLQFWAEHLPDMRPVQLEHALAMLSSWSTSLMYVAPVDMGIYGSLFAHFVSAYEQVRSVYNEPIHETAQAKWNEFLNENHDISTRRGLQSMKCEYNRAEMNALQQHGVPERRLIQLLTDQLDGMSVQNPLRVGSGTPATLSRADKQRVLLAFQCYLFGSISDRPDSIYFDLRQRIHQQEVNREAGALLRAYGALVVELFRQRRRLEHHGGAAVPPHVVQHVRDTLAHVHYTFVGQSVLYQELQLQLAAFDVYHGPEHVLGYSDAAKVNLQTMARLISQSNMVMD